LLHYTRKIWSDVGRVVRAQGVTVSELQAATARVSMATRILQCWQRMHSKHVALDSFENFLFEAQGVLSPLDDEEPITEEREYAVACVIATVYNDYNEWFKKTTEELRAARATERVAVSESAVENNDKDIQENFLHVETAQFLKEKIVLSLRTDVCEVAIDNKSVVVRANGVFRPDQGDASRKLLQVPLMGDVTVRNEAGVQPRVLVKLTHSKREFADGHEYQALAHAGRKTVTLLHKKEDGQVLQLELRRYGTVYKLKDADMDFQRRQERRQRSRAVCPKPIEPQSSTECSADTTSSEDEGEGSPILGKVTASEHTVTETALPTQSNSAAVVSKSLADKSSCGRRNFVRRQARKSKDKARNTTAAASNGTSPVATVTTSCPLQGEPCVAATPCAMDTNKSANTPTDAMPPQASAANNTSCHVVPSVTNKGEGSPNSTDKGPAITTQTEKQPAQGTKKRAKPQLFTARDCAGTRQSNVSRKPSKTLARNIRLSVHEILAHYGRGYKVYHAATRRMTTHQLHKQRIQRLAHDSSVTLHRQLLMKAYKQLGRPFLYVHNNVLHCTAGHEVVKLPMREGHLAIIQHIILPSLFISNATDDMPPSKDVSVDNTQEQSAHTYVPKWQNQCNVERNTPVAHAALNTVQASPQPQQPKSSATPQRSQSSFYNTIGAGFASVGSLFSRIYATTAAPIQHLSIENRDSDDDSMTSGNETSSTQRCSLSSASLTSSDETSTVSSSNTSETSSDSSSATETSSETTSVTTTTDTESDTASDVSEERKPHLNPALHQHVKVSYKRVVPHPPTLHACPSEAVPSILSQLTSSWNSVSHMARLHSRRTGSISPVLERAGPSFIGPSPSGGRQEDRQQEELNTQRSYSSEESLASGGSLASEKSSSSAHKMSRRKLKASKKYKQKYRAHETDKHQRQDSKRTKECEMSTQVSDDDLSDFINDDTACHSSKSASTASNTACRIPDKRKSRESQLRSLLTSINVQPLTVTVTVTGYLF
jgi:hypothetical protein